MASALKKYILIIEDDIILSDNISTFFSKKNIENLVAHTGKEAIDVCLKQVPDFILCDINLPDMNGFSVIQELKMNELTKSVPFIFMSGTMESSNIEKGLKLGAKDYIAKPFKISSMLEVINTSISESIEEKQTILVIEDDPDIRDNIQSLFSKSGYNVLIASNGKEGLEKAFDTSPNLVICDILLPELDGYSVLEELTRSEKTTTIPFIYLSAKSDLSDFRKGMSLGADDYITKPFKAEDLLNSAKKRINKLKNIKKLYNSSGSLSEGNNETKNNNYVSDKSIKEVLPTGSSDVKSLSANELWNIKIDDVPERSIKLFSPEIDKAFENFLSSRTDQIDYQSYNYNNVFVILNNLRRANQNEAILFYKYLQNTIEKGYLKIVIDMTKIENMDSTYLGVLISSKRWILSKGGKIKLVVLINNQFSNPMLQQSLEKNFEIYKDLKTAIQSY